MADTVRSIAEMVAERPEVQNQALFDALWQITGELKVRVAARFALTPDPCSAKFQPYTSLDGAAQGWLSSYAGPEIDWLIYSWIGTPESSFTNMHLTISLGPKTRVPHFGFALGTAPDIFMYMDYLPRVDIWTDTTYVDRYLQPVNERFLALRADERFSPFVSQNVSMRLYQSPTSLCFMVNPQAETLALVRETAHEMLDRWLSWVDEAEATPAEERAALAARDQNVRAAICRRDPANAIAVKLFGQEMADELVATLWGGNRTLPRPTGVE